MKYLFSELVLGDEGLLKGPFGSDLKKSLYVPKGKDTYKVYLQENILKESNTAGTHYISKQYFESSMYRYQVHENDFIVTCDGTLGEIFQIKGVFEDGIISSSLLRISLNPDLVDYDYFYYYFKLVLKKVLIKQGNNSVLKHLPGIEVIRNVPIDLPSISTQKAIGFILKTIDDKKKKNELIISELEAMAKDIYDYWFVQFDFPDENGKPYKSSGGKMVWNEELKREIPEGWKVTKIGSVTELSRGISYNSADISDNGIPMINLGSFSPDSIYKPQNIKYYNGRIKDESNLKKHDLLICTTQQTSIDNKTDIIGKTIMIPDIFTGNVVASMDLVKVSAMQEMLPVIASETKTPWYNKYITGFASGTSILHLNLCGFMDYKIPLPKNTYLLKKFSDFFYTFEDMKSKSMLENQELTSLRDFLLPLLMNGQVKVGDMGE